MKKRLKLKRISPEEQERRYLQALADEEIEYYAAQQHEEERQEALAEEAAEKNYNPYWQHELIAARAARNALNDKKIKALTSQKQRDAANEKVKQARRTTQEPFFNYEEHAWAWIRLMNKRDNQELEGWRDGYRVVRMYPQLLDLCERNWPCLVTLCQLIHWDMMNRTSEKVRSNSFWDVQDITSFYKAAAELALETGLSEDAVERSYRRLEKLHIMARGRRQVGGSPVSVIYLNFKLITEAYHIAAGKMIEAAKARRKKIGKREPLIELEIENEAEQEKEKAPA